MEFNVGDKVHYSPKKGPKQNGIIKRIDPVEGTVPIIYVVYYCNNDWDNYANYTGIWANQIDLVPGWQEIGQLI